MVNEFLYRNAIFDDRELEYLGRLIGGAPSLKEIDMNFSK